jgi:hypothetical protein
MRSCWVALLVVACDGGPHLDSATPASAHANDIVALTGRHLCGSNADCATAGGSVAIGLSPPTVQAIIVSYMDTTAQIQVPAVAPIGKTDLVLTVNGQSSNALAFDVLP